MKRESGASSSKTDNGKKQKTRYFCKAKDRYGIKTAFGVKPGMPGILVFCDRNKEKQSIRECIRMFNEVAKELHPELDYEPEIDSADDIETSIANEIESLKNNDDKKTHKFFFHQNSSSLCLLFDD
ncbi:hypothetical protein DSO57_1036537 [Entomophthora muscae]|uniref:Uncharacterized protein n=1 Tax=Entomophthora muscae TaxID=34485 RepID=A0ACC2S1C5_9FUNG|nr:hypothetical protein DSO57_1036537 [Entomophthora muscae]